MKPSVFVLIVLAAGCGRDELRVSGSTYAYTPGAPDWISQRTHLLAPRAAHGLVALPGRAFLVIGGDRGKLDSSPTVEPALDIERCVLGEPACVVVGRLARPTEQPTVARAPDGTIVVADWRGLQIFDPATGTTAEVPVAPHTIVATAAGVVLLGIEGARDRTTNLPGPYQFGLFRGQATGLEPLAAAPNAAWAGGVDVLDGDRIVTASRTSSALLDVATETWTVLPSLPTETFTTHVVQVGDGLVLAIPDGAPKAYLLSAATLRWTAVAVPTTTDHVQHALTVPGGAVVVTSDGVGGATRTFRVSDGSWLAGPPPPPWSILNAAVVLDDGTVISVGGCDSNFIDARAS